MKFEAELWAFGDNGKVRSIEVPANELTGDKEGDLELIYRYGQNDFQPVAGFRSVSEDDVIRLPVGENLELWKVHMIGFLNLERHEFYHDHIRAVMRRYRVLMGE